MFKQFIPPNKIELIIFDVDGTLYNQKYLRQKMMLALLRHYLLRPAKIKELKILYHFRKEREKRPGYSSPTIETDQYLWCAEKLNLPKKKVYEVVKMWMYDFPLRYLNKAKFPEVTQLFQQLYAYNIKIAAFSDFPAVDKMGAMELKADFIAASTDEHICSFKPSPIGIEYICNKLNVDKKNCIMVGDRYSRDGKCAENAGIEYIILPDNTNEKRKKFLFINTIISQDLTKF